MSDIHQVFSLPLKSPKIPIKYGFLAVVTSKFNSRSSINDSRDSWDWQGERYKTIKLQSLFSTFISKFMHCCNICISNTFKSSDQTSGLTSTFNDTQGVLEHSRHSESTRKHGYLEGTRACRSLGHLEHLGTLALRHLGTRALKALGYTGACKPEISNLLHLSSELKYNLKKHIYKYDPPH